MGVENGLRYTQSETSLRVFQAEEKETCPSEGDLTHVLNIYFHFSVPQAQGKVLLSAHVWSRPCHLELQEEGLSVHI